MAPEAHEGAEGTRKLFFLKKATPVCFHCATSKNKKFIWNVGQIGPILVHFGGDLDIFDTIEVMLAAILNFRGHPVQNRLLEIMATDFLMILV